MWEGSDKSLGKGKKYDQMYCIKKAKEKNRKKSQKSTGVEEGTRSLCAQKSTRKTNNVKHTGLSLQWMNAHLFSTTRLGVDVVNCLVTCAI